MNNIDHHERISKALEKLYIHYKFFPTNEEYKSLPLNNRSAYKSQENININQRILDTKQKRIPEFIKDKKYIFECPKHANTIASILVNLHRSGIIINEDQLKSLCLDDGNYLEMVFEALQALNPPSDETALRLYKSKRHEMISEASEDLSPTARKTPLLDLHLDEQISDAL